ncbi:RNA polymerase sigma factor [Parabacteroides pacaensis]|uniref:RNA polymerase sigma factor n=1 Tax=Parabacteroides pacaensis TaxID=2086575 RepID=UPI001F1D37F5|nr:RNA polymerase sigma-70 factor [Parabacteroides pacaensis]
MKNNIIIDEWVFALSQGNRDAFCELYAHYKDRIICYASRLLKSRELAEDLYQEAFISIWQNCPPLTNEESFSRYLYTIVRNRVFNLYREALHEQSLKESILSRAIPVNNETEELLEDKELNVLLEKILLKLPSRNRLIFRLSREEMLSYKEIASKLDISVSSVQKHMSDSLNLIREFLSEYAGICTSLLIAFLWLFTL